LRGIIQQFVYCFGRETMKLFANSGDNPLKWRSVLALQGQVEGN